MTEWVKKIKQARKDEKSYRDKGKSLWDKYSSGVKGDSKDVVNIFNPTIDIMLSALFSTMPKPDIRRRFAKKQEENDKKDALYRSMATVADYAIQYNFDRQRIQEEFESVFLDGFITGRGVGQVVYDYDTTEEKMQDGSGKVISITTPKDQVFKTEHVDYQDFVQEKAKKQKDVTWMGRMHLFTKKELVEEFDISEEAVEQVEFSYSLYADDGTGKDDKGDAKYAQVWEIWDKEKKERLYICESYEDGEPLRVDKDPMELDGFFPFSVFKTIDNGKDTMPTAEYCIYEDLNKQLQRLNARSMRLTNNNIKYVTVASNADEKLQAKIKNARDGDVIGVPQAPNLAAAQQVGAIPIMEAMAVKDKLDQDSQRIIDQIWEITGVSDIMRGSSQVGETATAQRAKGVFGTLRIQNRQKGVQLFIRETFRKMSECVCQYATIEELKNITCLQLLSNQEKEQLQFGLSTGQVQPNEQIQQLMIDPTWEEVKAGLTDDRMRGYTIDVESTATVFDNVEEERVQINALTANVVDMLLKTSDLIARSPATADLMEQLTLANLSTFKIGRSYTDNVKTLFTKIKQELSAPQQPNPALEQEMATKQADMAIKQQKAQVDVQKAQLDKQKAMIDAKYKQDTLELDRQKAMFDAQNKTRETDIKQQDLILKQQELNTQTYLEEQKIRNDIPTDANLSYGGVADLV